MRRGDGWSLQTCDLWEHGFVTGNRWRALGPWRETEAEADADARLHESVDAALKYAAERIATCRRQEAKFGFASVAIDANTERRALEAMCRMLTGDGE